MRSEGLFARISLSTVSDRTKCGSYCRDHFKRAGVSNATHLFVDGPLGSANRYTAGPLAASSTSAQVLRRGAMPGDQRPFLAGEEETHEVEGRPRHLFQVDLPYSTPVC
jgi:hypothetical protein